MRSLAVVAIAMLGACSPAPPPRALPPASAVAAATPSDVDRARSLDVRLVFDEAGLHVRIVAHGPAAELRAFRGPNGPMNVEPKDGIATLAYDVRTEPESPSPRASVAGNQRFRVMGDRALAIPADWLEKPQGPVALHLVIESKDAPLVASSFGAGTGGFDRRLDVRPRDLLRAIYLGGGGGRAEFDAPEGHDEAAWLGYTAFDPRAVSAEVAGFRSLLNEYFFGKELRPATLFFWVDARDRGQFRVVRVAESVFVMLSGKDAYDAPLRLAVAHELVHAWIGERLWVGSTTPGREAESYWFQEGVARWIAREQLARAGLLGPDELAAETNRLLGIVATSPSAETPRADLVAQKSAVPLLVARGALFATAADARIREASKGAASFDDVVRALVKKSDERAVAIDEATFLAELSSRLPGGAKLFDDIVVRGSERRVPDGALGACFTAQAVDVERFDPGFDVERSIDAGAMQGVDPKGPAAKAGLNDGDAILGAARSERVGDPVKVLTPDPHDPAHPRVIAFAPVRTTRRGQGFKKRAGLSDDACRKLFVRK